jgi:hypothetical protein
LTVTCTVVFPDIRGVSFSVTRDNLY